MEHYGTNNVIVEGMPLDAVKEATAHAVSAPASSHPSIRCAATSARTR